MEVRNDGSNTIIDTWVVNEPWYSASMWKVTVHDADGNVINISDYAALLGDSVSEPYVTPGTWEGWLAQGDRYDLSHIAGAPGNLVSDVPDGDGWVKVMIPDASGSYAAGDWVAARLSAADRQKPAVYINLTVTKKEGGGNDDDNGDNNGGNGDIPPDVIKIHFGPTNQEAEDYYYIKKQDCTLRGLGLDGVRIQTQTAAQETLGVIDDAIIKKDKVRAYFWAMQNRLENTCSNLQIQAENLQAAESRISDVDVAAEMTAFVRSQMLANTAATMLA